MQLPPCYSKRQLYQRFCYEKGWIAKCNAKGTYPPINQLERTRPFDDENEEMAYGQQEAYPEKSAVGDHFYEHGTHTSHS